MPWIARSPRTLAPATMQASAKRPIRSLHRRPEVGCKPDDDTTDIDPLELGAPTRGWRSLSELGGQGTRDRCLHSTQVGLISPWYITSFQNEMKLVIKLSLLDACYRPSTPCQSLVETCAPIARGNVSPGQCGPVPETGEPVRARDGGVIEREQSDAGMSETSPGKADAGNAVDGGGGAGPASRKLAAGVRYTCALRNDGTVRCWGQAPTQSGSRQPMQVTGLSNVVEISAGYDHACARMSDGSVSCWGDHSDGQLGSSGVTGSATPIMTSVRDALEIAVGDITPAFGIPTAAYNAGARTTTVSWDRCSRTERRSRILRWVTITAARSPAAAKSSAGVTTISDSLEGVRLRMAPRYRSP